MAGNEAFEDVVNQHYEALYRFAFSLAQNEPDACDLVQETYLAWARKGDQLRDRAKVKGWLFTTLYRRFLGWRRRTVRFPHQSIETATDDLPTVSPQVVRELDGQVVLSAMGDLPDDFRVPLTLFYLEDRSYKEIAEMLGVPIGTVMSRLSRAKATLRRAISDRVQDTPDDASSSAMNKTRV